MFKNFTLTQENLDTKKSSIESLIQSTSIMIEELKEQNNPTFESFVSKYQQLLYQIELEFTPLSHLNYVCNTPKTEEVYNYLLPKLTQFHTKLSQDEKIYQIFKNIYQNEDLNHEQKRVLELEIKDFELSGVGLDEEKKQRLQKISLELSLLQTDFAQNLLKATDSFEMEVEYEDIKEFPKSDLENAKKDNKYIITLKQPSYITFMTYSTNQEKREKLYKAYVTRAPENEELITKILSLRDEEAKILGFKNFAKLSLAKKMADSPDEVIEFLEKLLAPSYKKAKEELKLLEEFAGFKLNPWDTAYYSEKLKKQQLDIDDEIYMPYFEKEATLKGMFEFLEELFDIEFIKIDTKTWHESVEVYELKDKEKVFGRIYCDLESREGKRGGAWMNNWQISPQSAFIVANFSPASKTTPSLLRPSDVETLFHEMGHALHHLFSKVKEININGINGVEWDGVEFPSQFLENFAYEPKVLKRFAKHYETKEVLPDNLIQKLQDAKNFQSAMMMVRQIEFSLFDMKIHLAKYDAKEVQDILDDIRKKVSVIIPPSYNKFQNSFSHIFAGGYSAGYYSYKWAEVLSSDAFFAFVDRGIFNKDLAKRYKEEVLEKGGSRSIKESFYKFLQKQPDTNSLLRLCGILT